MQRPSHAKRGSQLVLFDCEGEISSLFDDLSVFKQLPSNCECCLFWNKNNQAMTVKLDQLCDNQQVYLYPSDVGGASQSVMDTLTHVIGQYVFWYRSIFIVHGLDDIYNEVIQHFNSSYGRNRIRQRKIEIQPLQLFENCLQNLSTRAKN